MKQAQLQLCFFFLSGFCLTSKAENSAFQPLPSRHFTLILRPAVHTPVEA